MARVHAPSEARALVQEARRGQGRPLAALLADARRLPDPGHAAETLATLAAEPDCPPDEATRARSDACDLVAAVPRDWRRAEVMGTALQMAARADAGDRVEIEARLLGLAEGFDLGEGRSAVIAALAPHASHDALKVLLDLAASNGAAAWDDARGVLRTWLDRADAAGREAMVAHVRTVEDAALRARMLGYVDRRIEVRGANDPLEAALDALGEIEDPNEALEGWRSVLQKADSVDALVRIHARLGVAPAEVRLALLPALVGRAYRENDDPCALAWHDEALAMLPRVAPPLPRVRALVNLAKAHARAGHAQRLAATRKQATEVLATMNEPARTTWTRKLEQAAGGPTPVPVETTRAAAPPTATPATTTRATPTSTRPKMSATDARGAPGQAAWTARTDARATASNLTHHALALHDTYTGGLGAAHLRAVARVAPLCDAFDLDLVLFDFPVPDAAALGTKLDAETNIGEGAGAFDRLVTSGRVRLVATQHGAPPVDWSALGVPVATTPHPASGRRATLAEAARGGERFGVADGRLCVVMGLGKQGLPKRWLDMIPFHYEITGRDVSLETATAMGILAERLRALGPAGGRAQAHVAEANRGRGRGRGRAGG